MLITHIVTWEFHSNDYFKDVFVVLSLPGKMNAFACVSGIMDFLRHAMITKGVVAFVERDMSMRQAMLLVLSLMFCTPAFQTYTMVNQ